ncbi:hypothetical protein Tco_0083093, partial [Tanacetum coccineum]
ISTKDKNGLGYDSHVNESEVLDSMVDSVLDSHESDGDNNQVNDRFKKNDSVYKSNVSETITSKDSLDTTTSETSKDSLQKTKIVRLSAPIIEYWKSDSDDDYVDYKFYENKMVGKSVLDNVRRATGQREVRPVWNNAQRVNHQNKLTHLHPKRNFVLTAVLTKCGNVPVNTAKQSSLRAAVSNSTARYVNIAASRPTVNGAKNQQSKLIILMKKFILLSLIM